MRLAQKNKIDIGQPTIDEVKASYQFDSPTSFLQVYYVRIERGRSIVFELLLPVIKASTKEQRLTAAESQNVVTPYGKRLCGGCRIFASRLRREQIKYIERGLPSPLELTPCELGTLRKSRSFIRQTGTAQDRTKWSAGAISLGAPLSVVIMPFR